MAKKTLSVIIQTSIAGHTFSYVPGQHVEMPHEIGKAWVKAGIAKLADDAEQGQGKKGKKPGRPKKNKTEPKQEPATVQPADDAEQGQEEPPASNETAPADDTEDSEKDG